MNQIIRKQKLAVVNTFLMMVLAISASVQAAEVKTPYEVVTSTASALVNALNTNPERFKKDPSLYEKVVRDILVPAADFKTMSKVIMGKKFYTQATKEQRAQFAKTFEESLVSTYSTGLEIFDNQEIKVLKPSEENSQKKVQPIDMEVKTSDGTIFPLRFSLKKQKDGTWKVINVIINGVNVGKAYKNHFAESMVKNGNDIDKVIATWDANIVPDDAMPEEVNAPNLRRQLGNQSGQQ